MASTRSPSESASGAEDATSHSRSRGPSSLNSGLDLAFAAQLPDARGERPKTEVPFHERARCELYKLIHYTWPRLAGKDPTVRHTHVLEAVYRLISCNQRDGPVFVDQFVSKRSPVDGIKWLLQVWEQFAPSKDEEVDGAEDARTLDDKFSERYWVLAIAGRLIGTSEAACKELTHFSHRGTKGYFIYDGPIAQGMQPTSERRVYKCAVACFDAWCHAMEMDWIPPLGKAEMIRFSKMLKVTQRGRSRSQSSNSQSTDSDSSGVQTKTTSRSASRSERSRSSAASSGSKSEPSSKEGASSSKEGKADRSKEKKSSRSKEHSSRKGARE